MKTILIGLLMVAGLQANAEVLRDVSNYNLEEGVGLKGYDPVGTQLNEKATKGTEALALEYDNVIYKFASEENQEIFLDKPGQFEPTYGGWCAYAMALGKRININPAHFIIVGDRIHYFVNKRAKRNFAKDIADFEKRADDNWKEMSGEAPPEN